MELLRNWRHLRYVCLHSPLGMRQMGVEAGTREQDLTLISPMTPIPPKLPVGRVESRHDVRGGNWGPTN